MLRQLFAKIKAGTFLSEEQQHPQDGVLQGGVIKRTAFTAAVLNSTRINNRPMLPDVWEGIYLGYAGVLPQDNKPVPFQYIQQDSYRGLLPWEIQPEIPERKPWE